MDEKRGLRFWLRVTLRRSAILLLRLAQAIEKPNAAVDQKTRLGIQARCLEHLRYADGMEGREWVPSKEIISAAEDAVAKLKSPRLVA